MSFDLLAPHYRWMEWVLAGGKLQNCRSAFLDRIARAENILIAGEGNGRFLSECLQTACRARITVVDSSAGMLQAARERLMKRELPLDRVEFRHQDLCSWKPDPRVYDVVVTHFFLDCFPAPLLKEVIAILANAAAPQAAWLLADFAMPAQGWQRWRSKLIHLSMYSFFRTITRIPARHLSCPDDCLKERGFVLIERRTTEWGLLHSDYWKRFS